MHRTHPPNRSSSAGIGKARCTDVIYSVVWFTSTGELHERIYTPHTLWKAHHRFSLRLPPRTVGALLRSL
jgi:hypothetical protein